MHTKKQMRRAMLVACGAATVLLTACGGGSGNGDTGSSNPPQSTLSPLSGGAMYVGSVSFGDSIAVELDKPAAGKLTLSFLDSRYGLAGKLVGDYTIDAEGTYTVSGLTAADGAVPAALASGAADIDFQFTVEDGVLSGPLGRVPNVAAGNDALLQGYVSTSNRGAELSSIAGQYSYLRQAGNIAAVGQLKISADGSLRTCAGSVYADDCAGGESGKLEVDVDQQTFPGAFSVTLGGERIGRLFVAGGQSSLFIDEAANATDGSPRNGNWVLKAQSLVSGSALNGDWVCAEPELDAQQALTGRTARNIISIENAVLAADNIPQDVALTYNAGLATDGSIVAGFNGLVSGKQGDAAGTPLTWLPVNAKLAYQLRKVPDGAQWLKGVCVPMAAEVEDTTYKGKEVPAAGDSATKLLRVKLGDLRPTQPAIGYDQIYYKLGRYAVDIDKKFDEACETNGQNKIGKVENGLGYDANSRLGNLDSFGCTKNPGEKPGDMKTLVIGPAGKLYLTDGHHSFTSVWESVSTDLTDHGGDGSQAEMYVIVKGDYSDLNRATFFRTLRANKLLWLKDNDNKPVTPYQLPKQLGLKNGLKNDPYRSLVYFTRDIGYEQPSGATEFTEFYWGDWLRTKLDVKDYNLGDAPDSDYATALASYLKAVEDASRAMVALQPTDVVSNGFTAATLGGMTVFDANGELAKLAMPLTDPKPGKLPYAVDYKVKLLSTK